MSGEKCLIKKGDVNEIEKEEKKREMRKRTKKKKS